MGRCPLDCINFSDYLSTLKLSQILRKIKVLVSSTKAKETDSNANDFTHVLETGEVLIISLDWIKVNYIIATILFIQLTAWPQTTLFVTMVSKGHYWFQNS